MFVFDTTIAHSGANRLAVALRLLGFTATVACPENFRNDTLRKLLQGRTDFDLLNRFDAVCGVLNSSYIRLDRAYPDAKFILMDLDEEQWVQETLSQLRRNDQSNVNPQSPITLDIAARLLNIGCVHTADADYLLEVARARRAAVQEYFARVYQDKLTEKLLVFRFQDGWEALCAFLGKPIPNSIPFPQ